MRAKLPYKKKKKRLGCGNGSGHGKTSTKGHKGQRARSGFSQRPTFEGGQNPLYRRLPKRGFSRGRFEEELTTVNVDKIDGLGEKEVSPEVLVSKGIVKKVGSLGLKILGNGEIKTAVSVKAHSFSESARKKIEKAGGQAVVITAEKKA